MLFNFWVLVPVALISAAGIVCAKRRAYTTYVAFVAALWLVAASIWHAPAPHYSPLRTAATSALVFAPVAILYGLVPGLQVRGGASHVRVVVLTAIASGIAFPLWVIWWAYVDCWFLDDCFGG